MDPRSCRRQPQHCRRSRRRCCWSHLPHSKALGFEKNTCTTKSKGVVSTRVSSLRSFIQLVNITVIMSASSMMMVRFVTGFIAKTSPKILFQQQQQQQSLFMQIGRSTTNRSHHRHHPHNHRHNNYRGKVSTSRTTSTTVSLPSPSSWQQQQQQIGHKNDSIRLFASTTDFDGDSDEDSHPSKKSSSPKAKSVNSRTKSKKNKKSSKTKKKKNEKLQLDKMTPEEMESRLVAAFDELARKDGFDESMSYMADDATFEDFDFKDDFDDDDDDDDDDDGEFVDDVFEHDKASTVGVDNVLSDDMFTLADFEDDDDDDDDDDEYLDFGDDGSKASNDGTDPNSMAARIAQAKRDMVKGTVSVPDELDEFAGVDNARRLGFRVDMEDEDKPRERAKLISHAMTCSACGSAFQATNEHKPGYLPPEKFEVQVNLSKVEELQKLQEKAESQEWSTDDEIEWLLQTQGKGGTAGPGDDPIDAADIDINGVAQELGLDLEQVATKKVICKRCHSLQHFGKVEDTLRPGWTEEPTLSQQQFRELLAPISKKPAVVVALIDLFDFSGSVLRELDGIAGENPVIVAANKADLLPSQMGKQRVENWVRRELEYMGVRSLANIGGAVRLVSCKTGEGVSEMLKKARELAEVMDGDVYVVGAANAGKSTLINNILGRSEESGNNRPVGKIRAGNKNAIKGALTTSPLPGTTLKFIKIDLGDGRSLYDTPGLLVPGTITQLLTPEELKIVCPKKKVEPITFRVAAGKCVLVGGLAKVEIVGDCKPFLLTFFVANEIKLHPTDSSRADEFIAKHAGEMLTPPLAPGPERMEQIGEFDSHVIEIEGAGWKEAAADITLTGLGWVAVTGAGRAQIRISVPAGIGVSLRPPLMPFDIWEVAAKYTGGRAVRKTSKTKTGKRRRGVGRS